MPDEGLHGLHPSYRLYATAEDQWVFLAVPEDKEKKRFAERLTALGIEVDIAILTRNDETTVGHLSEIFKGKNAVLRPNFNYILL